MNMSDDGQDDEQISNGTVHFRLIREKLSVRLVRSESENLMGVRLHDLYPQISPAVGLQCR